MDTESESKKHEENLGKLLANLQSLELLLRENLSERFDEDDHDNIFVLEVGDSTSVNFFSNYDSLGQLMKKYNRECPNDATVPNWILDIRDALAHGRIASDKQKGLLNLVKFSKPAKDGTVCLEFKAAMTHDWFKEQINGVLECAKRIKMDTNQLRSQASDE